MVGDTGVGTGAGAGAGVGEGAWVGGTVAAVSTAVSVTCGRPDPARAGAPGPGAPATWEEWVIGAAATGAGPEGADAGGRDVPGGRR